MSNNTEVMIEQSMLAQQVYLAIVRRRHLAWANTATDPEIKRGHLEIAGVDSASEWFVLPPSQCLL